MLKARVPQPPRCGAKTEGNKRQRGSLFFGFFLLAKQKKEARLVAKTTFIPYTCLVSRENPANKIKPKIISDIDDGSGTTVT